MDIVKVIVDRKKGSVHPKYSNIIYPINYGYIENLFAQDGEEQDVYILGVYEPIDFFEGKLIAIIHRKNDVEDKWVVCPNSMSFSKEEIEDIVFFQEQYFDSYIEMICK